VCQENIPHTLRPPACTVVTTHDGSMFSFCLRRILTLPSECLNRHFLHNIFSGDKGYQVGSSDVVAHQPHGCACCGFTYALQHFSQSCSSISLNQSAHSPLTSSINKVFSHTGLPHTGCFSLFTPFFVNPRKWLCVKIPVTEQIEKYSDPSGTNKITIKSKPYIQQSCVPNLELTSQKLKFS